MKDWYWFTKNRDADIRLYETMRRLSLTPYSMQSHCHPSVKEMISGIFNAYGRQIDITNNFKLKLKTTYYDGTHCVINVCYLQFYWHY